MMHIVPINKLLMIALLIISNSVCAESTSDDLVKMVRKLCLAGDGFKLTAEADGSITLKDLSGKGSVRYTRENLDGAVNVPDSDKMEALSKVTNCIQPHIEKILNVRIQDGDIKKKIDDLYLDRKSKFSEQKELELKAIDLVAEVMNLSDQINERVSNSLLDSKTDRQAH